MFLISDTFVEIILSVIFRKVVCGRVLNIEWKPERNIWAFPAKIEIDE